MFFQEFMNDVYLMGVNLQRFSNGELRQNPDRYERRSYYYLYYEAAANPCLWRAALFPDAPYDWDHDCPEEAGVELPAVSGSGGLPPA